MVRYYCYYIIIAKSIRFKCRIKTNNSPSSTPSPSRTSTIERTTLTTSLSSTSSFTQSRGPSIFSPLSSSSKRNTRNPPASSQSARTRNRHPSWTTLLILRPTKSSSRWLLKWKYRLPWRSKSLANVPKFNAKRTIVGVSETGRVAEPTASAEIAKTWLCWRERWKRGPWHPFGRFRNWRKHDHWLTYFCIRKTSKYIKYHKKFFSLLIIATIWPK